VTPREWRRERRCWDPPDGDSDDDHDDNFSLPVVVVLLRLVASNRHSSPVARVIMIGIHCSRSMRGRKRKMTRLEEVCFIVMVVMVVVGSPPHSNRLF